MKYNKKYSCNESYFENIDSEEKAYWLGFLFADGCITKTGCVQLQLNIKDKELIEKFKIAISSNNPIIEVIRDNYYKKDNKIVRQHSARIRVCCKKMREDLAKYGCVHTKTFILKFPENIKKKYIRHFIRGYFDGDGSAWISNGKYKSYGIEITSTKDFIEAILNKIRSLLKDNTIGRTKLHKNKIHYILRYHSIKEFKLIYNFFYKNSTIFLERKKRKIESFPQDTRKDRRNNKKNKIAELQGEFDNNFISGYLCISKYRASIFTKELEQENRIKCIKRTSNREKIYKSLSK